MSTRIITDTSIWIEFFRNADTPVSDYLKHLLRSGQVALTGMVLAEILQGIKSPKEARLVRRNLESLPFVETGIKIWQHAGETSATLRKKGHTIPLSDIIIASTAMIEGYEIFTTDPHFDMIPGLILHKMTPS